MYIIDKKNIKTKGGFILVEKIYLVQNDDELVEMKEEEYESESLLQLLLEKYPDLLGGEQINIRNPRRWLLISREMGVPSEEDGGDRWSVDHLFLDQDGIPTIVEVKRSSDTRIRREVIGQILDYAANAVVYWPVETIKAKFNDNCMGEDSEVILSEFLSVESDNEEFWQKVKTNLQAGKVRLVFVADEIPNELRRVVEFLNEQMDPAEVLAVEIKQFIGQGMKTLVPRVIGQTAEAQKRKSTSKSSTIIWDELSFFKELEEERGKDEVSIAQTIKDWAKIELPRFEWRKSTRYGIFWPCLDYKSTSYWPIGIRTDGQIEIIFQWLSARTPFNDEVLRKELLDRINTIPGASINRIIGRPTIQLSILSDENNMNNFLTILDWIIKQIKNN